MATNRGSSAVLLEADRRDVFDEIVRLMDRPKSDRARNSRALVEEDAFVLESIDFPLYRVDVRPSRRRDR
jgi:hypothetical protein